MKAIIRTEYGSSGVLRLEEQPRPEPDPGHVLVEVRAAGIGPDIWHLMTGRPLMVRAMGFGLRAPKNPGLGNDVAGVVAAVGAGVTSVRAGDEVYGFSRGAFADYAVASADKVAPKPQNLTFEQAAAVPVSGSTALRGLRDVGGLRAGQSLLVIGASGGVGTFAVQIGKALGADVTGMCSAANAELVRSLGADHVIDYAREDVTDGRRRFDVVLDTAGRRPLRELRRALQPHGTLVIVGGEGGGRWTGGFGRQIVRAPLLSLVVGQTLRPLVTRENGSDLVALTRLIEAGQVTPVVSRTVRLADAAAALSDAEEGHGRGKVVVTVSSSTPHPEAGAEEGPATPP
jgi:NADPH:quinone reductase-like Zn-dependent oxidoreductase